MSLRNFSSAAAAATLSAGVTSAATTIQVSATTGWPAAPFILALDAGAASQELVLVTNVAGTTLTVTRGYDSTVAAAHDAGAVIEHSHAAIDLREANSHVNASSAVHGLAGSVVGTSDTQTLTNKTLALGSNTVSGTKAQFNAAMTDADFATLTGTETLTNKDLSSATNIFPTTAPRGVLGYAQATSNQSGIGTSDTDLTSLSVAVTVGSGRRIRVTVFTSISMQTAGARATVRIKEGATTLAGASEDISVNNFAPMYATAILTPSSGAHTYKATAVVTAGATITSNASATEPVFILVEDIGGV